MKKIILVLAVLCLILAVTACSDDAQETTAVTSAETSAITTQTVSTTAPVTAGETATTTAPTTTSEAAITSTAPATTVITTPETTPSVSGLDKDAWAAILAKPNFENYTFTMSSVMDMIVDNQTVATSNINEIIRVTKDKLAIYVSAEDENSPATDEETIYLEGDLAKNQENQYSQIFMAMLQNRDNFTYDPESGSYKIENTVTFSLDLVGLTFHEDGSISEFTVPTTMVMRDGEVTFDENGKLAKFVCDYSQTMEMESPYTASGITTWTFSNFGTTVIE